jgi:glycerophosphoryl diester phosphodiesterase
MFGGSGVNQLKKAFMDNNKVPYLCRGLFFNSIERLLKEKVDVMIGNHSWQNRTLEKRDEMKNSKTNPFIEPLEWETYLNGLRDSLWSVITEESRTQFINYAHRGASDYYPENTASSFYAGVEMGANGIETDIQRTKDGVLVLFHDDTLERVTGEKGSICDYTYEELQNFSVKKGERTDKILSLESFLKQFADKPLTFAIEVKSDDTERDVLDLVYKYGIEERTIITSFGFERIKKIKAYEPRIRVGYLTQVVDDKVIKLLIDIGAEEICPQACIVTAEKVKEWHQLGFNVRAWGVSNEELMKACYGAGVDGMTINAPDVLCEYLKEMNA